MLFRSRPDFTKVREVLMKQSRFANLMKVNADQAELLYAKATSDARKKFLRYARVSGDYDKFIARESKSSGMKVERDVPEKRERKARPVDPEREARRAARKAARQAKESK